jgi:predicted NBD/HSP70 family sugar kinase
MFSEHSYSPSPRSLLSDTRTPQHSGLTRLATRVKSTRSQTRVNNIRLAHQIIYSDSPTSRAGVARESGLTPATASALVDELLEDNLVEEVGTGPSAGGKPPTLIAPNPTGRSIIAIDLSSTVFRGAVIDLAGNVLVLESVQGRTGQDGLDTAVQLLEQLIIKADSDLLGIGFGTPGVVDPETGLITSANLEWVDVGLSKAVAEVSDAPVHIINDAQAAALHEYSVHSPQTSTFAVVEVGRGIGTGYVLDGHLYRGVNGATGEIGHVRLDDGGDLCSCGNYGCLETKASMVSLLKQTGGSQVLTPERISELAQDPVAEPAIAAVAVELGRVLASVVALLAVKEIALWGEVTSLGEDYRKAVEDEIRSRVLPVGADEINVRYATGSDDAVVRGAAGLVLSSELGVVW